MKKKLILPIASTLIVLPAFMICLKKAPVNEKDLIKENVEALANNVIVEPEKDPLERCWSKFNLASEPPGGIYFRICGNKPWQGGGPSRIGITICKGLTEYLPEVDSENQCHIDVGPA